MKQASLVYEHSTIFNVFFFNGHVINYLINLITLKLRVCLDYGHGYTKIKCLKKWGNIMISFQLFEVNSWVFLGHWNDMKTILKPIFQIKKYWNIR
jgi:hypothetical protein